MPKTIDMKGAALAALLALSIGTLEGSGLISAAKS